MSIFNCEIPKTEKVYFFLKLIREREKDQRSNRGGKKKKEEEEEEKIMTASASSAVTDCDLVHLYELVNDIKISEDETSRLLDLFQKQYRPTGKKKKKYIHTLHIHTFEKNVICFFICRQVRMG